ncbi:hypothetical protein LCGC14_2722070 [marine sediment metagenome]|uniref:LamG-like jellyroll fold domain-containing protein n=1 Tax=marine sediment metagenome TaxID=412755 RepID=A0A0F8ZXE7_9ZZZZ
MSYETAFEVGRLFHPLKTIADAVSPVERDPFIHLPALRAYWPMSIVRSTGAAEDHAGTSVGLLRQGGPLYGFDGNAYIELGISNGYMATASSALNITGTEAWIASSLRGLTIGGWFWVDSTPSVDNGLVTKAAAPTELGFGLLWNSSNVPLFHVSGTGSDWPGIGYPAQPLDTWLFIAGRFTPSTEVAIFVNGDKAINTTSIPAAINVSTQNFEVGRYYNDNNRIIEGRARDVFICTAALSDETLSVLYQATRPA